MAERSETAIRKGQVWTPTRKGSRAAARLILWVGLDDCYGHGAVRWHPEVDHVTELGSRSSTMQGKAFKWWIKKHEAVCQEPSL